METAIRPVYPEEVRETAAIYVECWKNDYAGIVPANVLDSMDVDREAAECVEWLGQDGGLNLLLVAMVNGRMAGYVSASLNHDEPFEIEAEVNGLFVRSEFRGLGLGLRLLHAASAELKTRGYRSVLVYNFKESRSNRFYQSIAGKVIRRVVQKAGGKELDVDIFGWELDHLLNTLEGRIAVILGG